LGGSPKVGFLTQMGEDGQVWQLVLISQFGMPTIVSRIADWDVTSNVDTVFDKFVPSSEWVESTLYIVDEPGAYDRDARLIQNLTKKQMYYGAFDVVYFENNTEKTVDNFDEPVTGYVRVEYDIDSGRYKVYVSKEKPDLDKLQKAMELANRAVRLYEDGDVPTFDGPVDACSWLKEADQIDVNVVSDLCGVYYVK
jgi:transglutaminase-like putative cysteine protease